MNRLIKYRHKAKVLKKIQSDKMAKYHSINTIQMFISVIVSSLITFIGFAGFNRVKSYVDIFFDMNLNSIELFFNAVIFLLFINTMLQLVFQIQRKETDCEKAVLQLATFINDIDDNISDGISEIKSLSYFEERYTLLSSSIPANSDREYKKAVAAIPREKNIIENAGFLSETFLREQLTQIIMDSEHLVNILNCIKNTSNDLYLCGGQIRNAIWDYLCKTKSDFRKEDVDVIFYDSTDSITHSEDQYLKKLITINNELKWTVKNQARMSEQNEDDKYDNLICAIYASPDTCSAIAIRLINKNDLEIIAPYGLRDLFSLYVVPSKHIIETNKAYRYESRIKAKKWFERWSDLRIIRTNV